MGDTRDIDKNAGYEKQDYRIVSIRFRSSR